MSPPVLTTNACSLSKSPCISRISPSLCYPIGLPHSPSLCRMSYANLPQDIILQYVDGLVSPVHRSGRVQRGELVEGSNYHLQLEAVLKMTANVHNRTRTLDRRSTQRRQKKEKTPMDTARNFQPSVNRISVLESRLGRWHLIKCYVTFVRQ